MSKLLFLLLFPTFVQSQDSDILLLKKNNRTVRHFFRGSQIEFYTTEGSFISAVVDSIRRDSLFLIYYDVQLMPTIGGGMAMDTLGNYPMKFSRQNIGSFPARQKGVSFFTNGTIFMVGGTAYLLLNIVNTLREKDPIFGKDNLPRVIGGAAATAFGYLLKSTRRTEYRIGRKYKLVYLPAGPESHGP